ncbi:uncharacterized protein B0H64DRAFT_388401 [Chaetomium fimeti]|uniref:Uncharacterized protein n=1 Tax=Chaetomium fimeti TaxID=1854472 RepID=A0AAE0HMR8_9PEZI|nr:hypothetical protein B0H64DRAFT_388401 [Chaetomium fimeti]
MRVTHPLLRLTGTLPTLPASPWPNAPSQEAQAYCVPTSRVGERGGAQQMGMGVEVGGCRLQRGLQVLGLPLPPEWPHVHEPIIPTLGSGRKEIECGAKISGRKNAGLTPLGHGKDGVVCVGFGFGFHGIPHGEYEGCDYFIFGEDELLGSEVCRFGQWSDYWDVCRDFPRKQLPG